MFTFYPKSWGDLIGCRTTYRLLSRRIHLLSQGLIEDILSGCSVARKQLALSRVYCQNRMVYISLNSGYRPKLEIAYPKPSICWINHFIIIWLIEDALNSCGGGSNLHGRRQSGRIILVLDSSVRSTNTLFWALSIIPPLLVGINHDVIDERLKDC
ncbi:hypothetical protein BJX63DRAFT_393711 [Aspergillus granulosus]|uniref:Uncharacterized protein n=1 Tax=Aspergillus granulosus TaxID=176169 RepID=A0ABR4HDY1_9EURO